MPNHVEQVLISAVLNTEDLATPLHAGIDRSWFREYGREWDFILGRYKQTRDVMKPMTFRLKFPKFKVLAGMDDMDYAVSEMRQWHAKQTLMALMDDAVQGLETAQDPVQLIGGMYKGLVDLTGDITSTSNETEMVHEWRSTYMHAVSRANKRKKGKIIGWPSGWGTLDLVTGGLNPSEYWVLAARLGQGKTWALVRMVTEMLMAGATVQYHALEQTRTQLGMRFAPFLSHKIDGSAQFTASDLMHGNADVIGYKKFLMALEKKTNGKLILDDTPRGRLNSLSLSAKIERNEPDVVVIDYLGLMNNSPGDWAAVAALSSDCKQMASDYGLLMLVANQLNRAAGIGRGPIGPEALSGSDSIGMDADGVITLKSLSKHVKQVYLAKYRHGEDGNTWQCEFRPNTGIFDEVSTERAYEIKDEDADAADAADAATRRAKRDDD